MLDRDPWPREREGEPIETWENYADPNEAFKHKNCTHRVITDNRDDYDNLFYNEWLKVIIKLTRFIDWATIWRLGLEGDLEEMILELGMGSMATRSYDLYPELVRQFTATVQVYYSNERVKRANEGTLTFFIRCIRYRIPLLTLYDIYGFQNPEYLRCIVSTFLGQSAFWGHLASGHFDSGRATQTDIRHPTVRYFLKVLANTLLCKME